MRQFIPKGRTINCNKCWLPIRFKKLPNGKYCPTNPDGSDHWDKCSAAQFKRSGRPNVVEGPTVKAKHPMLAACDCPTPPWESCAHG
jgi:hypothetical protein